MLGSPRLCAGRRPRRIGRPIPYKKRRIRDERTSELSHDPTQRNRPTGFTVPIRDVRLSAGAGFITPLCGEMRTMPGLSKHPAAERIDIDENGEIVGLS